MSTPLTRYAQSGDASIAYQVTGEGPLDLLFLPGWISQVEQLWEAPALRRYLEQLATFSRVILFDRRGSGLSDRLPEGQGLEQDELDALAVLDAAGSERAALLAYGIGGLVAVRLAADHPGRVGALVLYAAMTRTSWAPDYHWAFTLEQREEQFERNIAAWGQPANPGLALLAPSAAGDPVLSDWFARMQRLAASPAEARQIFRLMAEQDVREALGRVRVPTLVVHRRGDQGVDVRHSRYAAEHIAGSRYVELEGEDSFPFIGDSGAIIGEVEQFLTGERAHAERSRALLTVMFTDIVDATGRAARLGDGAWRDLLARHDQSVRTELAHHGGREVKTVGDGFLAVFEGPPSGALRCARAIARAAQEIGIEIRVGIHTGECELIGEDVAGMAVHIAARVGALAAPGETLVSGTVYGTVVGGPFHFEDRGFHELRGVPGHWPLFSMGD